MTYIVEHVKNFGTKIRNLNDCDAYNEIMEGLYLGSYLASEEADKFDVIINCTKTLKFYSKTKQNYRVPVNDDYTISSAVDLYKYGSQIINTIHVALLEDKKVLVHCRAGMQRSAAIVAMFLIKFHDMSPENALNYIKKKRNVAFEPFARFLYSLQLLEADKINNFKQISF